MTRNRTADPEIVSQRLKQLRKKKGIKTQYELHEKTGVPLISIKRYESGATIPEDPNLGKIARFYRVDPAWILGKSNYKNIFEQLDVEHADEVKRIKTELHFMESAAELGYFDYDHTDLDSYGRFKNYVKLYKERKENMKTRKDIAVITGSDQNRIIDNFETGEITIEATNEENVEKGFQQLISRGIIAD